MKKYYSHVRATAFNAIKESLVTYIDDQYDSLSYDDHIDLKNTRMIDFYLFHIIQTEKQVFFRDILNKCITDKQEQESFIQFLNEVTVLEDIIEVLLIFKLINNDKNLYDRDFIDSSFRSTLISQVQEIHELLYATNIGYSTNSERHHAVGPQVLVMEQRLIDKAIVGEEVELKLKSKNALLNCIRMMKTALDSDYYN